MKMTYKVKTAVVGCGMISDIYLANMTGKYNTIDVMACCDLIPENARKQAEKYGIRACTYEEILADDTIEMVVVLTPAPTHYELIEQGLLAGKHVFSEKIMTLKTEEAGRLLAIAEEKGLYLGAAPDTFLGSGLQTARKAIDDGLIGDVTSFHIVGNRDIDLIASVAKFLRLPGGGMCFDYGVYHLTALVSLLGPVKEVYSVVTNRNRIRTNVFPGSPEYGEEYIYDNDSLVNSVITLENGITGTFSLNGDSVAVDMEQFLIYGTKGVLKLGDANRFDAKVRYQPNDYMAILSGNCEEVLLDPVSELSDNCRGVGPAEMAYSILTGKENRASKELAYHVLDTATQIMESSETRTARRVDSTCRRPEYFAEWKELLV